MKNLKKNLNIAATVLTYLALVTPQAYACDNDVGLALRGKCSYGLLNLYFQVACQDLFLTGARADRVASGAKNVITAFNQQVNSLAVPFGSSKNTPGQIRGVAIASNQTANFHLSTAQLIIAKITGTKTDLVQMEADLKARLEQDQSAFDYLTEEAGKNNGDNSQQIADLKQKLDTYKKIGKEIQEGQKALTKNEKALRSARTALIAMKNKMNQKLSGLQGEDAEMAQKEDELTEKLSLDEQSFWDSVFSNCFQNNSLRSGCSRALEAVEALSLFTGFAGGVKNALYAGGKELGKELFKSYISDDSLKNLIQCGESKPFTIITIDRQGE